MFAKMIVAAALVVTSANAFASDVSSDRHQAFYEKAQKLDRRAASAATSPAPSATPGPTVVACTCAK
jgi:hypothetical protein